MNMTTTWSCRSCGTVEVTGGSDLKPERWYRLTLFGRDRPRPTDVGPALYCSSDCLLVAVMKAYGLSREQTMNWLAGGVPA
jgi:hypothetical protein